MKNTSYLLEQSEPGAGPPMGRRGGEPCEPANVRQGAERGRVAWPRPRRLLAVEAWEIRGNEGKAVFIKIPRDVRQSSFELYPEGSAKFYFLINRNFFPNSARAKN